MRLSQVMDSWSRCRGCCWERQSSTSHGCWSSPWSIGASCLNQCSTDSMAAVCWPTS